MTTKQGIDPRGPRFGAAITAVLLLVVIGLQLAGFTIPALVIFIYLVVLFGWAAFAGIQRHPTACCSARSSRPRPKPPTELEDPTPPTFAQGVGFAITLIGLVLHLIGVP